MEGLGGFNPTFFLFNCRCVSCKRSTCRGHLIAKCQPFVNVWGTQPMPTDFILFSYRQLKCSLKQKTYLLPNQKLTYKPGRLKSVTHLSFIWPWKYHLLVYTGQESTCKIQAHKQASNTHTANNLTYLWLYILTILSSVGPRKLSLLLTKDLQCNFCPIFLLKPFS